MKKVKKKLCHFEVFQDNNPLTSVFTTASPTEIVNRTLTDYQESTRAKQQLIYLLTYLTTTDFPDVMRAICQTVVVEGDTEPLADSLAPPDTVPKIEEVEQDNVSADKITLLCCTL